MVACRSAKEATTRFGATLRPDARKQFPGTTKSRSSWRARFAGTFRFRFRRAVNDLLSSALIRQGLAGDCRGAFRLNCPLRGGNGDRIIAAHESHCGRVRAPEGRWTKGF